MYCQVLSIAFIVSRVLNNFEISHISNHGRTSLIPEILFLVEQICPRTTQIYNLGTPVSVLLQSCALKAVEGV